MTRTVIVMTLQPAPRVDILTRLQRRFPRLAPTCPECSNRVYVGDRELGLLHCDTCRASWERGS